MSRGTIILIAIVVIVLGGLFALASIDTRVPPAQVTKDMVSNVAPPQ